MTEEEFETQFTFLMHQALIDIIAADKDSHFAATVQMRLTDAIVKLIAAKTRGDPKRMNDLLEFAAHSLFEMAYEPQQMLAELDKEDGRSAP